MNEHNFPFAMSIMLLMPRVVNAVHGVSLVEGVVGPESRQ